MNSDFKRYFKQIVLPEIGVLGQEKFQASRILCVGAGGIGSPVLLYLAAAGIGTLGIIDDDKVDITNLHRQVLFSEDDCGQAKVLAAKKRLAMLNPTIEIEVFVEKITSANAISVVQNYDIIIDGTDNFAAKFLLNDCAVKLCKPLIHASVSNFEGRVAVFDARDGACYRCLYPEFPLSRIENCNESGILGPVVGMVGMVAALQTLKLILGKDICFYSQMETLLSKVWLMDALSMQTKILHIDKNAQCKVCAISQEHIKLKDYVASCEQNDDVVLLTQEEVLAMSNLQIVDVRDTGEWNGGHIDHAVHIPLHKILDNANELCFLHKEQPTLVYCKRGIRSKTAAQALKKYGFIHVFSLKEGLFAWSANLVKEC